MWPFFKFLFSVRFTCFKPLLTPRRRKSCTLTSSFFGPMPHTPFSFPFFGFISCLKCLFSNILARFDFLLSELTERSLVVSEKFIETDLLVNA